MSTTPQTYEQLERQNEFLMDIVEHCKEVSYLEKCLVCEVKFWPRISSASDKVFCSSECEEEYEND